MITKLSPPEQLYQTDSTNDSLLAEMIKEFLEKVLERFIFKASQLDTTFGNLSPVDFASNCERIQAEFQLTQDVAAIKDVVMTRYVEDGLVERCLELLTVNQGGVFARGFSDFHHLERFPHLVDALQVNLSSIVNQAENEASRKVVGHFDEHLPRLKPITQLTTAEFEDFKFTCIVDTRVSFFCCD